MGWRHPLGLYSADLDNEGVVEALLAVLQLSGCVCDNSCNDTAGKFASPAGQLHIP